MVPSRPDIDAEAARKEIEANQDRIEAAFLKYIHRAEAYEDHEMVEHSHEEEFDDNPHEFEVIVGHGNVIRYFFCRALQLPPEVWLRFSTFNCSISKCRFLLYFSLCETAHVTPLYLTARSY